MAATSLGVAAERLTVSEGVIHDKADANRRIPYAELIGGGPFDTSVKWNGQMGLGLAVTGQAKLKDPSDFKVIGKSPPRRDPPGKVFGTLEMAPDVRLPSMLHARMIRPEVAGAVPVKVDDDSIKDIPGAKAVWIKDLLAVVADREWNAVRAAQKLKVTWSDSKPNFPGHDNLHEHIRKALVVKRHVQVQNGDFDQGIISSSRCGSSKANTNFRRNRIRRPVRPARSRMSATADARSTRRRRSRIMRPRALPSCSASGGVEHGVADGGQHQARAPSRPRPTAPPRAG
jgi:hypothetical protein